VKCGDTKAMTPETWVYKINKQKVYQAHGQSCLACEKKRKAAYDARRKLIEAGLLPAPTEPAKAGSPEDKRKELKTAAKLDVARALKAGSQVLNDLAASALARLAEYVEDPDHELHSWALEFTLQRVLPRKLYEELGGEAAGVGALRDARPQFIVNVLPAVPAAPVGPVHEGEFTDVTPQLKVLPA